MSLVEFQRKISQAQLQETIGNLNRGFSISGESKGAPTPNGGTGAGGGGGGDGGGADNNNTADPNFDMFDRRSIESRISYKSDNVFRSTMNYCVKYYKPNGTCMKNFFFKRFPFFSWIISYDIKECLLKDLVAGLTVNEFITFKLLSFDLKPRFTRIINKRQFKLNNNSVFFSLQAWNSSYPTR